MRFHLGDNEFKGLIKLSDLPDASLLPEKQRLRLRVYQASSEIRAARDCEGFAAYIYSGGDFIDRATRASMKQCAPPFSSGDLLAFSRPELRDSLVMTHWGISLGEDLVLSKYGQGDLRIDTVNDLVFNYGSDLVLSIKI